MMANKPLLSVVMATYNHANYIEETINSILNQTITDFELIIADDGSTDETSQKIYSFDDSRIKYLKLTHKGLPAPVRNEAIKKSKGNYIAFIDSDDLWLPQKLKKSITPFKNDKTLGIVTSKEFIIDENSNRTGEITVKSMNKNKILDFETLFFNNIVSSSAAVVKRESLEKVGYFEDSRYFRTVEDSHLWMKIASQYNVFFLNEILGCYRIHSKGISQNREENKINLFNALVDIRKRYPELFMSFSNKADAKIRRHILSIAKFYIEHFKLTHGIDWILKYILPFDIQKQEFYKL